VMCFGQCLARLGLIYLQGYRLELIIEPRTDETFVELDQKFLITAYRGCFEN